MGGTRWYEPGAIVDFLLSPALMFPMNSSRISWTLIVEFRFSQTLDWFLHERVQTEKMEVQDSGPGLQQKCPAVSSWYCARPLTIFAALKQPIELYLPQIYYPVWAVRTQKKYQTCLTLQYTRTVNEDWIMKARSPYKDATLMRADLQV